MDDARTWLADEGYDPVFGARPLKRVIQRALQDPLAELVKIEPKSIGVGQYQHDVDQFRLGKSLEAFPAVCFVLFLAMKLVVLKDAKGAKVWVPRPMVLVMRFAGS